MEATNSKTTKGKTNREKKVDDDDDDDDDDDIDDNDDSDDDDVSGDYEDDDLKRFISSVMKLQRHNFSHQSNWRVGRSVHSEFSGQK